MEKFAEGWKIQKDFCQEPLTWNINITGDQFLESFKKCGYTLTKNLTVLEIGAGIGRILDSFKKEFDFKKWILVEINPTRAQLLKKKFENDNRVVVLNENIIKCKFLDLDDKFDFVISSLTFKHFFPDFTQVLTHLNPYLNDTSIVVFDIRMGDKDHLLLKNNSMMNVFTPRSMNYLIEASGYLIEKIGTVIYPVGERKLYCIKKVGLESNYIRNSLG